MPMKEKYFLNWIIGFMNSYHKALFIPIVDREARAKLKVFWLHTTKVTLQNWGYKKPLPGSSRQERAVEGSGSLSHDVCRVTEGGSVTVLHGCATPYQELQVAKPQVWERNCCWAWGETIWVLPLSLPHIGTLGFPISLDPLLYSLLFPWWHFLHPCL